MTTHRSLGFISLRFAGWTALLGVLAIAACNRAPSAPEKMTIAPATPGTASGFVALRQEKDESRQQEASDNRFDVSTAYVFIDRDSPEYYDIVLLDKPLDNQKLAESTDPSDVVEDALRGGANGLVIMSNGNGGISGSFRLNANGKTVQFGGSGSGDVRGLVRTGDRVTGHVHYFSSVFGDHIAIDSSFDAPLLVAPKGTPLPPDGGDAGEAYLETVAAMRAGDVDKLMALMPPEQAKAMAAERTKPDFAEAVEFMKALAPDEVQVTGGTSYGERVVLTTKGRMEKEPFTGTVEMTWVEGGWRKGKSSDRMGGGSDEAAKADAPKEPKADEPPKPDVVPVFLADGVVGKGFRQDETEIAPTHAFAVALPVEDFGEGRMIMLFSAAELVPKNAKAMWAEEMPLSMLFADGKLHPAIWVELKRDERGELEGDKKSFLDAEGNFEDAYITVDVVETGGKLVGTLTQSMQINDEKFEGVARYNLPVNPAP